MSPHDQDTYWMQRALELARRGIALTSPNPAVGCVILDSAGKLVGEGWHEYDLLDHAEIAALKQAQQHATASVHGGTAYVTLEPCNHIGRTGPCTEALIAAGTQARRDRHRRSQSQSSRPRRRSPARRRHRGEPRRLSGRGPPHQRGLRALDPAPAPVRADESRHDARRAHRPARWPAHASRAVLDHGRSGAPCRTAAALAGRCRPDRRRYRACRRSRSSPIAAASGAAVRSCAWSSTRRYACRSNAKWSRRPTTT